MKLNAFCPLVTAFCLLAGSLLAADPAAESAAPAPKTKADFAKLRKEINTKVVSGEWKTVKQDLPHDDDRREFYIKVWFEGEAPRKLLFLDSRGDDNQRICTCFWLNGKIVSAFEIYTGARYTGDPAISQVVQTYNFEDGKLISWHTTPGGDWDPAGKDFQEVGPKIWTQFADWYRVIELGKKQN
jgi:hypothetical protein